MVGVFLYQWPFENEFGGFATAQQATDYQYGKADYSYTIESENSASVLSNRSSDVLHKENGRFYLISPTYISRKRASRRRQRDHSRRPAHGERFSGRS